MKKKVASFSVFFLLTFWVAAAKCIKHVSNVRNECNLLSIFWNAFKPYKTALRLRFTSFLALWLSLIKSHSFYARNRLFPVGVTHLYKYCTPPVILLRKNFNNASLDLSITSVKFLEIGTLRKPSHWRHRRSHVLKLLHFSSASQTKQKREITNFYAL